MHVCRAIVTYRQMETRTLRGWGFNLGPGSLVSLDASLSMYGAPASVTLRSLIERGEIDAQLFEEVQRNQPAFEAYDDGEEGQE